MSRTLSSKLAVSHRGATLVVLCGSAMGLAMLGGCAEKRTTRTPDTTTPVNTGLSRIDDAPALGLPENDVLMEQDRTEASIRSQIEESARQLSVYFTNLELDGPPATNETTTAPPVATSSTGGSAPVIDPPKPVEAQRTVRTQPNPDVGGADDGGVRVSLMDLAGGSDVRLDPEPGDVASTPVDDAQLAIEEPLQPEMATGSQAAEVTNPQERRDMLARELGSILGELVVSGQDPGASAFALASLETLLPDDMKTLVDSDVLSEPERASIDAVRSLLGSMTSEGAIASPDQVSAQLDEIKQQLDAWSGLAIKRAALCTRVDGYGRYETFPSYRFMAGRDQEMIVYTELERFAQTESTGPDGLPRYRVELSQRLELYHVADDLNTWNRAAETVRDESRNRLRDYYLTNRVRLPGNLGVGRYHLKVVMRDLIGEKVAETIIPIEIVAR
jgi:hypothetical protein